MRTTGTSQAKTQRRTGGRSARVVRDVLDATVDALADSGYSAFSFEDVAARAGVSRTTIYRRWPTKQELVRAALLRYAEDRPNTPDTGTLRGDLLESVRGCFDPERSARDAGLLRALMADFDDPELRALSRIVRDRARERGVAAVDRAIARGELPAGTDPNVVLDPAIFTLILRAAIFGDAVDLEFGERLVDVIIAGARTGAGVVRPRSA